MPSSIIKNCSLFQLLNGCLLDLDNIRVFGVLCYVSTGLAGRTKFDVHLRKCIFLGFRSNMKGVVVFDVVRSKFWFQEMCLFMSLSSLIIAPIRSPKHNVRNQPHICLKPLLPTSHTLNQTLTQPLTLTLILTLNPILIQILILNHPHPEDHNDKLNHLHTS